MPLNYTRPITLAEQRRHDDLGNCTELLAPLHQKLLDEGKFKRAGGDAECPICKRTYYSHPTVVGALWLKEGCEGFLLKL